MLSGHGTVSTWADVGPLAPATHWESETPSVIPDPAGTLRMWKRRQDGDNVQGEGGEEKEEEK